MPHVQGESLAPIAYEQPSADLVALGVRAFALDRVADRPLQYARIGARLDHEVLGSQAHRLERGRLVSHARRDQNGDRGDRGPAVSYYGRGYDVAPDENDYWGVESYDDFSADYRHIQDSIDRARERGSLRPGEARRFSRECESNSRRTIKPSFKNSQLRRR